MTAAQIRALSLAELSDGLQTGLLAVAEVLAAWGSDADGRVAQARLAGDAPFLCGVPFRGTGLVAENLERAGAIAVDGPAPFEVVADWDGAVLGGDQSLTGPIVMGPIVTGLSFRPSFGLLPRRAGEGLLRPLSEVPAIRAAEVRDLRRILQAASLRRWEDPDQVPLPQTPTIGACDLGVALDFALPGYQRQDFTPPARDFGLAWRAGGPEALALRPAARADWAVALHKCPLVALPTEMAGLVAGLGLPAARVGEVILAARWFADDLVLRAAELAQGAT